MAKTLPNVLPGGWLCWSVTENRESPFLGPCITIFAKLHLTSSGHPCSVSIRGRTFFSSLWERRELMFIRWRCPVQSLLLPFHEWMETLLDPPSSGDQIYPGSPGTWSLWVHDFYSLRLLWRVCQRTQYTTLQGPLGNKSEVFRFDPFYALLKGQKGRLKRFTTHQALNTQSKIF